MGNSKTDQKKQEMNEQQRMEAQNLNAEKEVTEEDVDIQNDTEELSETPSGDEKDDIIVKLTGELEQAKDTVLRKVAEYENQKKRLQKEKEKIYEDSKKSALESFLPIRDDLKRSLRASEEIEVDKSFLDGIQLVADKFEKVLADFGVEAIDEEMVPFDVDVHDALLRQPAEDDSVESNTVLKIIEPGYKISGKVIKHAKVIVSQ